VKSENIRLFVAGLSYKTAPVEVREQLSVPPSQLRCTGCRLKIRGGLSEVVLLSTCNRVEIYGVADRFNGSLHSLFHQLTTKEVDTRPYTYIYEGSEAVGHLFSVTSGLDSMVLGETEIAGQVKNAYQAAQDAKLTGRVLNRLFQKALQTAKQIRTHTGVGRGATSVGSVAVELAERIFGNGLSQQSVMIIGAGKMGEACIRHLAKKSARSVLVSNRSFERAQLLAADFGGRAIRFDECLKAMAEADIVVSSTGSPQIVLNQLDLQAVMRSRANRPLVLIDIAVPRDIDPAAQLIRNVYLYNIDDLEAVVRENVRHREQELVHCRSIIAEYTEELMAKLATPPERVREPRVPASPDWVFSGAAACAS
jgi:glutamyl-tRNA reductase